MNDMSEKSVIITGASRGIGEAAARAFAAAGARVALMARSRSEIDRIAGEIGTAALPVPCDVSDWAQMAHAFEAVQARFGRVDVLVNNAGVIEPIAALAESDPAGWDHSVDINLKGVYHGIRAVLPLMRAQGGGTVLTVGSGAAHSALEGWSHYCAAKAAVHMLMSCLHKEEAGHGIRAITLSPGTVATQMQREIKTAGIGPVAAMDWSDHIPPEWPAKLLVWLAGHGGDDHLGAEVAFRGEELRQLVERIG